ncbi:MaoC family dehydratase [Candidatus Woesearchaeota archaeon]|nr:MaoC family dehydratase [Candidatus Woesearchaeota archaeon]
MLKLNDLNYEDINVGKVFKFSRILSLKDIDNYAKLTGDFNPLHTEEEYAKSTKFNGRIAHGMLAASLFSSLLGMICPGKKNLYLSQTLNFKKPVYPGNELSVQGTIIKKIDSIKAIVIRTDIFAGKDIVLTGEATVQILESKNNR